MLLQKLTCKKCGHSWEQKPKPTCCIKCGHEYVEWVNYADFVRTDSSSNEIQKFYQDWFNKLDIKEYCERFLHHLYTKGKW